MCVCAYVSIYLPLPPILLVFRYYDYDSVVVVIFVSVSHRKCRHFLDSRVHKKVDGNTEWKVKMVTYKQDLPPKGGFDPIEFAARGPKRMFGGESYCL